MWEQQLLFSHLLLCMKQLCFVLPCHRQLILAKAGEAKQNSLQQAPRQQSQPYTLLQHYAATGCASCLLEGQPLQFWGWSPRKQGGSWGRTGGGGDCSPQPRAYLHERRCAGRSHQRAGSDPQPSTAAHPPPPARSCWGSSDLWAQTEDRGGSVPAGSSPKT